jgi:L-lactate dehydrogenase complex protein LldG
MSEETANSAREEILSRLGLSADTSTESERKSERGSIQRSFRLTGTLSTQERMKLFIDRLHDYGAGVHETDQANLPAVVSSVLKGRGKSSLHFPAGFPNAWRPSEFSFIEDHQLSYDQLDHSEGVITGCTLAIALTGTIVLQSEAHEGRRALTLIPDYHLCIVRSEQIVELVPEAMAKLMASSTKPTTLISGPSATADIEMKRVQGVHGPRVLDVIIVT